MVAASVNSKFESSRNSKFRLRRPVTCSNDKQFFGWKCSRISIRELL